MIEITVRIPDKVMADFVLLLEERYKDCDCPRKHTDPKVSLVDLMRDICLDSKIRALAHQREAERLKELEGRIKTDNPIVLILESMKPLPPSDEDVAQIKAWEAEYDEEEV